MPTPAVLGRGLGLVFPRRYADAVIASRPVSYWRLDETNGTNAYDQMGKTNGVYTGSPPRGVSGPMADGAAVKTTTGGGTWVDCGNAATPTAALSLACWAFITAQPNPDAGIFGRHQSGVGPVLYKPNSTSVIFYLNASCTSGAVSMNRWHFFVGTWDGTSIRLFVDGVLAAGPTATTAPADAAMNWCAGSYGNANSFTTRIISGSLAECAYWSRALPAGEIAYLNAIGYGT